MSKGSGVARGAGRRVWTWRHWLLAAIVVTVFAVPASASVIGSSAGAPATIDGVLGGATVSGKPIPCATQSDGVRVCTGMDGGGGAGDLRLASFDGTPLGLYVVLPPVPASGRDGGYPLMIQSNGWESPSTGPSDRQYGGPTGDAWARSGYAVLELQPRGFGDSCGTAPAREADPAGCLHGYVHLDDARYEAHDVQWATGRLVDEGIVDPARIGATGESYGGGVTLELATLRDRVMSPDGTLHPWRSPGGVALSIRAAAPVVPWSDLVDSLMPNGHERDDRITTPTTSLSPPGVEKQSFVPGLYAIGNKNEYYAPPATDPSADLTSWVTDLQAGEPYTTAADQSAIEQLARYRSPYYLLDGAYDMSREAPAPLLLTNGFTDDLFPVDQSLRYYNLERSLYPSDPVALLDVDGGHMRGQNKPADVAYVSARLQAFLDYYVRGDGTKPPLGATAMTQSCPASAPSGGPYWAPTWADLHPGTVTYRSPAAQTVVSTAGDPTVAATFDPMVSDGLSNLGTSMACQTASATPEGTGVATYRLPPATGAGYTFLGAPTVTADLKATGTFPYLAARLLDVDLASNTETLVARGVYRLDAAGGRVTFQLHPGAWHFAAGHAPELELLGRDVPYLRPANGAFTIAVSDLELQIPVHEPPAARTRARRRTRVARMARARHITPAVGAGWHAWNWVGYTRPATYNVITEKAVPITMPDGTVLRANVYRPDAPGRFPVLLFQNPYGTNGLPNNTGGASDPYMVQRGYVNLVVDVRGSGQSEGSWEPFSPQSQHDGYDLVEWAAHQSWSDGKVAGDGCSALAIMQLLTAALQPPNLKAIFPCLPMGDAYRDIMVTGGSVNASFVPLWFGLVAAGMVQGPTGSPADAINTLIGHASGLAIDGGTYSSAFSDGQLAFDGPYWRSISPIEVADRIRVPAFVTAGLHCIFQRSEPLLDEKIKQHAFARLLVGPWYHLAGFSGLPADGVPGVNALQLAWYDHWLKGIDTHIEQMPKVTQYEWGLKHYVTVPDWPDPRLRPEHLFLRGGAQLQPAPPSGSETGQHFLQNPATGICTLSASQWTAGGGTGSALPCENQPAPDKALGEASYETPPMTAPVTINGPILADLWLTTTARDAPVTVRVFDVAPDGSSDELTDGWLSASFRAIDPSRSRYANGQLVQPWHPFTAGSVEAVTPGVPVELPVEVLPTSAVIEPGHRLELVVASGDFPHQLPPADILAGSLAGTTTILTDPQHASSLVLPVVGTDCTLGRSHHSHACRTWPAPALNAG